MQTPETRRPERGILAMVVIWLVNSASLLLASSVLRGVECDKVYIAFVTGLVLTLLTYIVEPVLYLLTLPINVATFGMFTVVLNGVVLYVASRFVAGFHFSGTLYHQFGWAVAAAAIMGFFRMIARALIAPLGIDGKR